MSIKGIMTTRLYYDQSIWIRLAHRLYSDFQYFFKKSWVLCSLEHLFDDQKLWTESVALLNECVTAGRIIQDGLAKMESIFFGKVFRNVPNLLNNLAQCAPLLWVTSLSALILSLLKRIVGVRCDRDDCVEWYTGHLNSRGPQLKGETNRISYWNLFVLSSVIGGMQETNEKHETVDETLNLWQKLASYSSSYFHV